jgi:hypothetical protein
MKRYVIVAAILSAASGIGSNAYTVGGQRPQPDPGPAQAQSSVPATNSQNSAQASVTPKSNGLPAANTSTQVAPVKPKDSYMLVELTGSLKAKKLKVGDKVKAEVAQNVIAKGKIIIPVETKLIGHVTEVSTRDSGQPESRLGIVFDRILLKQYHDISFQAVVQALAPPVVRKSRVDEPSQMLPPSMMGVARDSTPTSGGRGGAGSSSSNRSTPTGGTPGGALNTSGVTVQLPLTVKESPSTNTAASAAMLETASTGKPSMSIGMPQGVIGLKGLSLSNAPTPNTPGPVIVSNTENVKLESGTQILLHVLKVEIPTTVKPAK